MWRAAAAGLFFVLRSPRLVVGLWLVMMLVALPGAVAVGHAIGASAGSSLAAERLTAGFDMGWYGEFQEEDVGVGRSFRPELMGIGAFLQNLEGWLDGRLFVTLPALVAVGVLFGILWAFLMAGVVSRAVHGRADRGFAAAMGHYGPRFVRLAVMSAVCYVAVYWLHSRLFAWLATHVQEIAVERQVLLRSLGGYVLTAFLLITVHLSFAYAKIATVAADRRSALLAAVHGAGFVLTNPLRTYGLFLLFAAAGAIVLAVYAGVAPGAGQVGWAAVLFAFALGQAVLVVRLMLKLGLLGAEAAFYASSRGNERRGR
jgi:hypothetical protein